MAFGLPFPTVASALGLFLGFDGVAVVADGSKVVRIARVAAIADRRYLVDRGCRSRAPGRFDLTLIAVAFEDAEPEFAPFACVDEL
jgi:hypothetical protein